MQSESENELVKKVINPVATVIFASHLFNTSDLASNKEDWVVLNAKLMEGISVPVWLNQFLDVISLPLDDYDGHDIINPSLAVKLSSSLQNVEAPLIKRDQWIEANTKLISELGTAQWLSQLLDVLENDAI